MASRTKEKEKNQSQFLSSSPFYSKNKDKRSISFFCVSNPSKKKFMVTALAISLWFILYFHFFRVPSNPNQAETLTLSKCNGIAPLYIYDLHPRFTTDLIERCNFLNIYVETCPHVINQGLGQPLTGSLGSSWFATNEFLSDLLFHARVKNHPCRTNDINSAKLFYIPFYAGLYTSFAFRESNHTLRDQLGVDLVKYLSNIPTFLKRNGRDHFLVTGRTSWDLMRMSDPNIADFGANRLLYLPELADVAMLTVERHPWVGKNHFGVPYPSYFHPKTSVEIAKWQSEVLKSKRPYLYAFIGGARIASDKAAIRADIMRQCESSDKCAQITCETGNAACFDPAKVLLTLRGARFCLQPPGLSFTRRSLFDSILAGCIPVFFSEHTAYTQYNWYLPKNVKTWSVMLEQDKKELIEEELGKIPDDEVKRMRDMIVRIIPRVTYAHPDGIGSGFKDVVDVALEELTKRVQHMFEEEQTAVRVD
ncbi:hypothetical protein LUZ60_008330 [Juncus effusus]|nr:hypothetical protein LUZ60_008330 [Juncus effusus]